MGSVISVPFCLVSHTKTYYSGFFHYLCGKGRTEQYETQETATSFLPIHPTDSPATILFKQHARVRLFALASNFYLYNRSHYRKDTYREDLVDNLRNVAIPGTGIPLSWMASSRWFALPYLMTVYPAVSLVAATHYALTSGWDTTVSVGKRLTDEYARRLLAPDDWFSFWRLNCEIVALHSLFNSQETQSEYDMENKWTFIKEGLDRGVPVSPILKTPALVVKHRNEEGGMGIYFYKNATEGGDWILQERIENSDWVSSLLPAGAPLSTFRVITCSKAYALTNGSKDVPLPLRTECVKALSCVFRAGRKGAATDHDSIMFDVDVNTGLIRRGTKNANWYQLGASAVFSCPWRSRASQDYQTHPDGEGIAVSGNYVPDIEGMLHLVEQAHYDMCPNVPFAGWDVVLSADKNLPVCLLEVNLSCNFFRGSFDLKYYLDFIEGALVKLQAQRLTMDAKK
mmetsp:Transcript_2019/g.4087  ORF Transcript_2019/g.4087 Transcript_2019/m.4087 type:complete len:456 (-) Transcript_2019:72-1439(-)|eukprot:CAMPEP_0168734882 /NCGR_PEP_ID=MMETSP0724-20121128/9046_1 /TAXON_ID=265536 /ORGANISM="Amphiprora sp., Strain CCMP467" /LENGTH=455 /DNA_ID=CAMNT_0008782007 /DNA_START=132 /DNA_END=1499 /DNA_ORIENTATION=-